jgi:hypothetical protein
MCPRLLEEPAQDEIITREPSAEGFRHRLPFIKKRSPNRVISGEYRVDDARVPEELTVIFSADQIEPGTGERATEEIERRKRDEEVAQPSEPEEQNRFHPRRIIFKRDAGCY